QKAEASEADEVDEELAVVQPAKVFAPKSLVLVSRLDYTEVFRVRHTQQFLRSVTPPFQVLLYAFDCVHQQIWYYLITCFS
ncbi:hypothetical protein, partial [Klebsiella pneumoniae]|uniref:hypothetical protein n=1 Tax=Klebsiella pneumoniae TaxID=573 RepID=UPI0030F436FC